MWTEAWLLKVITDLVIFKTFIHGLFFKLNNAWCFALA